MPNSSAFKAYELFNCMGRKREKQMNKQSTWGSHNPHSDKEI
jgi:hypothetical protein